MAIVALALLVAALAGWMLYLLETEPRPRRGLDSPHGLRPPVVPSSRDADDLGPINYNG